MGGVNFSPDTDIPDLAGKVIFVTGGTHPYRLEIISNTM
jgi:hypothetical protein